MYGCFCIPWWVSTPLARPAAETGVKFCREVLDMWLFMYSIAGFYSSGAACSEDGCRNYGQDGGAPLCLLQKRQRVKGVLYCLLSRGWVETIKLVIIRSHLSDGSQGVAIAVMKVPVVFLSALTFIFFNNTPLSRLRSEDSVKEH